MDTKFLADLDPEARPRFRALADLICLGVSSGEIPAGQKLPPVRDLAWTLKMSPGAVARAYKLAVERGALEATVGRGTFARVPGRRVDRTGAQAGAAAMPPPSAPRMANFLLDTPRGVGEGAIDLRGNQAPDVGQDQQIGTALATLVAETGGAPPMTVYRRREEDLHLLDPFIAWLRHCGIEVKSDRLLITTGAQAAVMGAVSALARGGSGVMIVTPTLHPGLRDVAAALGTRLEAVAVDDEGYLPDALDQACARLHPDAIQLTATLHNPTLSIMSLERRQAIAAVARQRNVAIIEDDVYGQLIPDPLPTFATLAPERTYYITSLSKCVAAGLRAGFLIVPPGRLAATLRAYQAFACGTPWLVKALASVFVRTGAAQAVRDQVMAETQARVAIAARILGPHGAVTHPAASFVYLPLPAPWTSAEFVAAAAGEGVLVPPASAYRVERSEEFVRIALGARVDRGELSDGMTRLAQLLADGPMDALAAT
ncbi:MAG: PLP-dependent aminotransferase family protein [Pseudomonadota bacterium]